jgi:hypothetical protein
MLKVKKQLKNLYLRSPKILMSKARRREKVLKNWWDSTDPTCQEDRSRESPSPESW